MTPMRPLLVLGLLALAPTACRDATSDADDAAGDDVLGNCGDIDEPGACMEAAAPEPRAQRPKPSSERTRR